MRVNSSALVTDNVAELLVKILEFTRSRHSVLIENLTNVYVPGFVPKDLLVEEFAILMADAVVEHKRNKRLILRDTQSIKFGPNGTFQAEPTVDEYAKELFESDTERYIQLQLNNLTENWLNHKLAAELLRHKEQANVTLVD